MHFYAGGWKSLSLLDRDNQLSLKYYDSDEDRRSSIGELKCIVTRCYQRRNIMEREPRKGAINTLSVPYKIFALIYLQYTLGRMWGI